MCTFPMDWTASSTEGNIANTPQMTGQACRFRVPTVAGRHDSCQSRRRKQLGSTVGRRPICLGCCSCQVLIATMDPMNTAQMTESLHYHKESFVGQVQGSALPKTVPIRTWLRYVPPSALVNFLFMDFSQIYNNIGDSGKFTVDIVLLQDTVARIAKA